MVNDGGEPDPVTHRYEAAPEDEPGGNGHDDRCSEIAAILATGYLRLLLANRQDAASPDVCATFGCEECAPSAQEGLEVPERKSVHVSRD